MRKTPALAIGTAITSILSMFLAFPVSAEGPIIIDPNGASTSTVQIVQEAVDVWGSAATNLPSCVSPVLIVFEELKGRQGEYRTAEEVVVINPKRTPSQVRHTVFHELGHHAMISCGLYRDEGFTASFYDAQSIPAGTSWFDVSGGWAGVPAEQFAEAVAQAIQGWSTSRIALSKSALSLVEDWMGVGQSGQLQVSSVSEAGSLDRTESQTLGFRQALADAAARNSGSPLFRAE